MAYLFASHCLAMVASPAPGVVTNLIVPQAETWRFHMFRAAALGAAAANPFILIWLTIVFVRQATERRPRRPRPVPALDAVEVPKRA